MMSCPPVSKQPVCEVGLVAVDSGVRTVRPVVETAAHLDTAAAGAGVGPA